MSDKKRQMTANRKSTATYSAKPHHIFRPNFKAGTPSPASVLSHSAAHALDNLFSQFNGKNNGDFSMAPKIMALYGWKSNGAKEDAITELLMRGFIEKTCQGGRNKPNLYAVTWLTINECDGKLDVKETRIPSNLWRPENQEKIAPKWFADWEKIKNRRKGKQKTKRHTAIRGSDTAMRVNSQNKTRKHGI